MGLQGYGAGLLSCRAMGQGSTFSPEAGGPAAWGKLAHGKQSPDQDWHPKTNESRDPPSGTGWICASRGRTSSQEPDQNFQVRCPVARSG